VYVNDNFELDKSSCTCPRAEDLCHHRAALLLHAKANLSKTDVPCKWVRRKEPARVVSVDELFNSSSVTVLDRAVYDTDRDFFTQELAAVNRFTGFGWLLSPEPQVAKLPVPLVSDLMTKPAYSLADNKVEFIVKRLPISPEVIKQTALATCGQRENNFWGPVRRGRLTASNFGTVLKSVNSGRTPSKSLLKSVLGQYDIAGMKAIQWGCTHESAAIAAYEKQTDKSVTPTGIWLSSTGCLGASPDGLVDDDKIIEVKCPYRLREASVVDQLTDSNFYVGLDDDGQCILKQNTTEGFKYYHQVQGNLALTQRHVCDFCVWTPQDMIIFPITYDDTWVGNIEKLELFYRTHYLPAFITGAV